MKVAVITGITGQDGSLLAEELIEKDYKVYGIIRRNSTEHLGNIEHIKNEVVLEYGDVTDQSSIYKVCQTAKPHIFINCAAQSHVGVSFELPEYTAQATGIGVLNCLEAIRQTGVHTRFLQLSSSEMFGNTDEVFITEETPMIPASPYASAKLFGYNITRNYRESYRMFASNSIAFNHEAPGRRGPNFVTRKVAIGVARIKAGLQKDLVLGNLDSRRDWGHAIDFVRGMIKIIEHSEPDDFILATGESHTVQELVELAFNVVKLDWKNYVKSSQSHMRPNELHYLRGSYEKASDKLGWKPEIPFDQLVHEMVSFELDVLGIKDPYINTATQGMAVLDKA